MFSFLKISNRRRRRELYLFFFFKKKFNSFHFTTLLHKKKQDEGLSVLAKTKVAIYRLIIIESNGKLIYKISRFQS